MRKFNFRAWLGLALVGATVAPLATQQAVAAPGDVNTEIRISVFKDGAGALDAAPDNAPLPSPSSIYGGTGATLVFPDAIADDQITGPISWDAGEDASYNNQVVRTFDQIVYKMEWNVNEQNNQQIDVATKNVVISSTLPDDAGTAWADLTWLGGNDLPPTCLTTGVTPVSSVSADGRTLTCNLGDQFQGSNGSVYPLARLNGSQNGKAFSLTASINSNDNVAPVTSNKVSIVASARPQWDWVKSDGSCVQSVGPPVVYIQHGECGTSAPHEFRNVVDQKVGSPTFGLNGRILVQPLVLQPSSATGLGTEPLASPVMVSFIDDFSRYPNGARMLDFTPIDVVATADVDESKLYDATGADGCRPLNVATAGAPYGDGANAYATPSATTALPGDWSCSPQSGNRQRLDIVVTNIDTANPPAKDSTGAANGAKATAAGQVAIWIPEGIIDVADIGGTANMSLRNFATGTPTATGGLYNYIGDDVTISESAPVFLVNGIRLATAATLNSPVVIAPITDGMIGISGAPNLPSAESGANNDSLFTYNLAEPGTYSNYIRYTTNEDWAWAAQGKSRRQPTGLLPGTANSWDGRGVASPGERLRLIGEVYQAGPTSLTTQPGQCITIDTTNQLVADIAQGNLRSYPDYSIVGATPAPNQNPAVDFYVANGYDAATISLDSWAQEMPGLVAGTDYLLEYAKVADVPSIAKGERLVGHYCGDAGSGRTSAWFDWNPAAGVDPGTEPALGSGDIAWSSNINNFTGPVVNGVQTYTLNKVRWKLLAPIADKIIELRVGIMIKPQTPAGIARDDGSTIDSVNCSNTGSTQCDPNFNAVMTDPYYTSLLDRVANPTVNFNTWLTNAPYNNITGQHYTYEYGSVYGGPYSAGGPPECYSSDASAASTGAGGVGSPFAPANPTYAYSDTVHAYDSNLENETTSGSWVEKARCFGYHADRGNIQLAKTQITKRVVNPKPRYKVGDQVTWEIKGSIFGANGDTANDVVITDNLYVNQKLISVSSALGVVPAQNAAALAGNAGLLTFDYGDDVSVPFEDTITVVTEITGGTAFGVIYNGADIATSNRGSNGPVWPYVNLVGPYDELVTSKQVANMLGDCVRHPQLVTPFAGWSSKCEIGTTSGPYTFGLDLTNTGLSALTNVRAIDVLPWNGDSVEAQTSGVGTTPAGPFGDGRQPASDFNGILEYTSSNITNKAGGAVSGVTTLVTKDAPGTVNRDPDAQSNGGTVGSTPAALTTWCSGVGGSPVPGPGGGAAGTGTCPATNAEVTAVSWVIGNIPTGESYDVNVVATPKGASGLAATTAAGPQCSWYTNSFGARTNSISLPVRSNDVTVMAACADVKLAKSYAPTPVAAKLGDPFTMNLKVTNDGPDAATYVKVTDILPAGLEFVSSVPAPTTSAAPSYEWTIPGPIAVGASSTIVVTVKATAKPSVLTNYAEVTGMDQGDLDSSPTDGDDPATPANEHVVPSINNPSNEDDEASAPIALLGDYVWYDVDGDGVQDTTELPVNGMTVNLYAANGTTLLATTTTAPDGSYLFVLPTGITGGIVEFVKPTGYLFTTKDSTAPGATDLKDSDADRLTGRAVAVTVNAGEENLTIDAGILLPASLGGKVWQDSTDNGAYATGDTLLEGVTVTLMGTDAAGNDVMVTQQTGPGGTYLFTNLMPGTYKVTETQPTGLADAATLPPAGSKGGTVATNSHTAIPLVSGDAATNYDFIEIVGASIAGNVYADIDNSGTRNAGDQPIAGVTVTLMGTDDLGNPVMLTTTTATNGSYSFTGLRPGTYKVTETQPTAYGDGADNLGTGALTAGTTSNDKHEAIVLGPGNAGVNYDFGELKLASIAGNVYVDVDNSGTRNAGDQPIPGVAVTLMGTDDLGAAVILTTTTAADGSYSFTGLRPGTYKVTETQPIEWVDNPDNLGTGASVAGVTTNDMHADIKLAAGNDGVNYDFGELKPASISGRVWFDRDNNGVYDPKKDIGLPSITVTLTGTDEKGQAVTLTTTTGSNGSYNFPNLRPGTYTVVESQPPLYRDGKIVPPGSLGGAAGTTTHKTITISVGQAGVAYDFPEFKPEGALPATGNSSLGTPLQIGAIGVAAGLGLLLVSRRRRKAITA
jgi:uncharacterized repeat protein (TIGR01451 family)/LPXTG-motif cell wall-anchored protein